MAGGMDRTGNLDSRLAGARMTRREFGLAAAAFVVLPIIAGSGSMPLARPRQPCLFDYVSGTGRFRSAMTAENPVAVLIKRIEVELRLGDTGRSVD